MLTLRCSIDNGCHDRSAAAPSPPPRRSGSAAARLGATAGRLGSAAAGMGIAASGLGRAAAGLGRSRPPGDGPQPGWNPGFMPSQVGSGRFRSMSVGEWLDATFSLYRRNFVAHRVDQRRGADPVRAAHLAALRAHRARPPSCAPRSRRSTRRRSHRRRRSSCSTPIVGVLAVTLGLLLVTSGRRAAARRGGDHPRRERPLSRPPDSLRAAYRAALSRLGALIVMILHPRRRLRRVARVGDRRCAVLLGAVGAGGLGALLAVLAGIALIPVLIMVLRAHRRRRPGDRARAGLRLARPAAELAA